MECVVLYFSLIIEYCLDKNIFESNENRGWAKVNSNMKS